MERIDRRALSRVPKWLSSSLSANEAKDACVYPSRARPTCRSGRIHISDFRFPRTNSLAISSRSIHLGQNRTVTEGRFAPIAVTGGQVIPVAVEVICETWRDHHDIEPPTLFNWASRYSNHLRVLFLPSSEMS